MEKQIVISGRSITEEDIETALFIVDTYGSFSRKELANTMCECLDWVTSRDKPKVDAGIKLLEYLEEEGLIVLPPKNEKMAAAGRQAMKAIPITERTDPKKELTGELSDYAQIELKVAYTQGSIELWKEYIERYHPLKYAKPVGTNIKYLIKCKTRVLGCMLFSASAWALEDRDKWIGWNEFDRSQRLIYVVNNTRFLILPWVKINNLASHILGKAVKQLPKDWLKEYRYQPVLLETFVDTEKYAGTCYKASNWINIGRTKGRGRYDRNKEYLSSPKDIYMYPLRKDFRKYLTGAKEAIIREMGIDEW
jgi:hypothetical protein